MTRGGQFARAPREAFELRASPWSSFARRQVVVL